ncbi:glycosyltransferase family 4 protein [Nitrospira sp. M1]
MKILLVHNYYQQPGGEDQVFHDEYHLLLKHGHDVSRFTVHNDQVRHLSTLQLIRTSLWGSAVYEDFVQKLRTVKPAIVHFHNTFPLLSPQACQVAQNEGCAVIQTLHNYRLLCPKAIFFRDGSVCEQCLNRAMPWPSILHGCYRDSYVASSVVATMLWLHRHQDVGILGVNRFIALTEFARKKFIDGGLPADKLTVKPNFVSPDPGMGDGDGQYALFVGRLTPEKGLATLIRAWEHIGPILPLKVVGDGPEHEFMRLASQNNRAIDWLGRRTRDEVVELMKKASVLIFPSEWYEGFPMTIVEAYAVGLPVIASKIGGMASLICDKRTGLHFSPNDHHDLCEKVRMYVGNQTLQREMRLCARAEYVLKYSEKRNYQQLIEVYQQTLETVEPI